MDPSQRPSPDTPTARAVSLRCLRYARPYLPMIVGAVLLGVVFALGRFGRAYLLKPLLDEALPVGDLDRFYELAWLGAALVVSMPLAKFGRGYLTLWSMGRISLDVQKQLAAKLLRLPLAQHQSVHSGDILTRTLVDADGLTVVCRMLLQDFMQAAVMIVVGVVTMLAVSWKLALMTLSVLPPTVIVMTVFARRVRRRAGKRQAQYSEVTQRLSGILSGIKVIKAFRGQPVENEAFGREAYKYFKRHMRVVTAALTSRSMVEFLNSGSGLLVLFVGSYLVLADAWELTIGDLAAFTLVTATIYTPIKKLSKGWPDLMAAVASAERFLEILDEQEEPEDRPGAIVLPELRDRVSFDRLCFSYGGEPVIRDVSFEAKRGEVIAIVGPTGAGKTTLSDLLLRFYEPDSGSISIDGIDLRDVTRESFLDQVAVVTQESFLFDTSIRENILYGRPDASEEAFQRAVRTAHVDEFVDQLPAGFDTRVGEFGLLLSGGQRQRITIARALLKDPSILVFDEATSALDSKTERIVQEALDALRGRRTVFVIAHRLSTIRHADRILVLEHGRVAQLGTHEELMTQQGLYRELLALQNEDPS